MDGHVGVREEPVPHRGGRHRRVAHRSRPGSGRAGNVLRGGQLLIWTVDLATKHEDSARQWFHCLTESVEKVVDVLTSVIS